MLTLLQHVPLQSSGNPHPLVISATAIWKQPGLSGEPLNAWLAKLPKSVESGPIPTQADLNAWAVRRTNGMLGSFPLMVLPETVLILASALASSVMWDMPFQAVDARELGSSSPWANQLTSALLAPKEHRCWIASTGRTGDVAVHSARAKGGLEVVSVIAAPDVSPVDVIAVAHQLAGVGTAANIETRSLFDLPLGEGPAWKLEERPSEMLGRDEHDENVTAVLPAWSARSDHDLISLAGLGFDAVTAVLAGLLPPDKDGYIFEAKQSVLARFSRLGFEATAATAVHARLGFERPKRGKIRTARLRFGHPFAVVAVTSDRKWPGINPLDRGPWDGLPIFSAWVAEPEDAGSRVASPIT